MALPQDDYNQQMEQLLATAQRLMLNQAAPTIYHQAVIDTLNHVAPAISEGTRMGSSECAKILQQYPPKTK